MQYATESKVYFFVYDQYGDPGTVTAWSRAYVQISKDGGAFTPCTNNPILVGVSGSGIYCLTLTAAEMTCDSFLIQITPYPTNLIVPPIIGEPQRVTPAADTSTLATASAVSALQTSVNAIPTTAAPTAAQNASAVWGATTRTLTDMDGLKATVARILGLAGDFTINGTTLTATNADGTTSTYTLTLDSSGNITGITETTT